VKGPSVSVSIRSMGKSETRERPRSERVISALTEKWQPSLDLPFNWSTAEEELLPGGRQSA